LVEPMTCRPTASAARPREGSSSSSP
jgi:hypothetical protein